MKFGVLRLGDGFDNVINCTTISSEGTTTIKKLEWRLFKGYVKSYFNGCHDNRYRNFFVVTNTLNDKKVRDLANEAVEGHRDIVMDRVDDCYIIVVACELVCKESKVYNIETVKKLKKLINKISYYNGGK